MHLESSSFDLISPYLVVNLHVIEDSVHKTLDVWVFISQEFKYNLYHLGLVEHNFSSGLEEQEFKEGIQNLLYHLIILLFSSKQILKHLNQIRISNLMGYAFRSTNSGNKHDRFKNNIIFGEAINKVIMDKI
jgi:hypothetical protein